MMSTLLLNAGYEPVKIIPWQRAVTLVVLGKAELVEAYDEFIRGVNHVLELPAVVRLFRHSRQRRQSVKFSRMNVYRRDCFACQYCGATPGASHLTLDHVLPRARGGRTEWNNIVAACEPCNARKADRTPEQAGMTLMRAPARPGFMPAVTHAETVHPSWREYIPASAA